MADRLKVCLFLEGTYPYITGGVSAWVHDLIRGIPEVDFVLATISPEADQQVRYELPENVVEHRDITITRSSASVTKPGDRKALLDEIKRTHDIMFTRGTPRMEKLFSLYPEGYSLSSEAVTSTVGWEMLTATNQQKNPLYPFADYFWAWKSAHDMLFTVLASSPPEADVYHSVSTGFAGMAALAAKIRRNRPFILTEHGLYHKEREMEIRKTRFIRGYQRDMWTNIYNSVSRMCYQYADKTISLFKENMQLQLDMGSPPERTVVIPNGIDIQRYEVARSEREGFHVGLVGRVVPIKDIKTFIATAKIVLHSIPEARFYCIGPTDEDEMYYQDCVNLVNSLRISENFIFTGRQDVREYYSFLNALILTSVREAQPLVILEGYVAGVPAVATKVGNIPELLDFDERLLAPPKDAEKLARGIIFIHDNPEEVKAMEKRNRKKVYKRYDRVQLHKTYRGIYEHFGGDTWRE